MPTCVPIKDMRDTVAFAKLVESAPDPVVVTKNGYDKFVVMRSADYDRLVESSARARLMERIALAEHERAAGQTVDTDEAIADLRKAYGL